jgi:hypothetical protein
LLASLLSSWTDTRTEEERAKLHLCWEHFTPLVRIFGHQLMLHNKNETRPLAPAIRFLLLVFVCFEEAFAKALSFDSLKTKILWPSEMDL